MKERSNREVETDVDFLAPYFVSSEDKELSAERAAQIRDRCLADYKDLLVQRANRIKQMFEKVT